jgi:hypothetical protein
VRLRLSLPELLSHQYIGSLFPHQQLCSPPQILSRIGRLRSAAALRRGSGFLLSMGLTWIPLPLCAGGGNSPCTWIEPGFLSEAAFSLRRRDTPISKRLQPERLAAGKNQPAFMVRASCTFRLEIGQGAFRHRPYSPSWSKPSRIGGGNALQLLTGIMAEESEWRLFV